MGVVYRWAYPKVYVFKRLIFTASDSEWRLKNVLDIRQTTRKLVWAKVFSCPVKKWRLNLVINNMLWDHLVYTYFDSRFHHVISLMHLGVNENTTLFCHFFEQVLVSNSSFEARIISTENYKVVLCVVWSVWSVYIISASNCQTPYKKLTIIVNGPFTGKQSIWKISVINSKTYSASGASSDSDSGTFTISEPILTPGR